MFKKLFLAMGGMIALLSVGCSNPCDDLVCETCSAADATNTAALKLSCEVLVAADDADSCDLALDNAEFDSCR